MDSFISCHQRHQHLPHPSHHPQPSSNSPQGRNTMLGGRGPPLCPLLLPHITPSDSAPVRTKLVPPCYQVTQSRLPFWLPTHAAPKIPHSLLVLETAFLPVQGHEGFQHCALFLFPFPLSLCLCFFPGCRTH